MANVNNLISSVVASIGAVVAAEGIEAVKTLAHKTLNSFQRKQTMKTNELAELAELIKKSPPSDIYRQVDIDTLSRWFEIPRDDFERLPRDRLNTEVLVRHVYLEQLFAIWLNELGYNVMTGLKMLGVDEWEFVPDVYAEMETLHGVFQVVVNFVCDDPPSTSRTSFLCESLEAFASRREPEFSEKDIFMLVTPFKFSATSHSIILKEDKDHKYFVIKVESSDLYALQQATSLDYRRKILINIVKESYGPGGIKTWV